MLDEVTAIVDGYNAYFSFSKVKTGYSGKSEHFYSLDKSVRMLPVVHCVNGNYMYTRLQPCT